MKYRIIVCKYTTKNFENQTIEVINDKIKC